MRSEELTIFLADDDEDDREFFRLALRNVNPNASLIAVTNGVEALEFFARENAVCDLVFLDINMPLINGIDCLKQIRTRHQAEDLPVIMLSTSGSPAMMQKSFELGANIYLQKPNHLVELGKQISFCIRSLNDPASLHRYMVNTHSSI